MKNEIIYLWDAENLTLGCYSQFITIGKSFYEAWEKAMDNVMKHDYLDSATLELQGAYVKDYAARIKTKFEIASMDTNDKFYIETIGNDYSECKYKLNQILKIMPEYFMMTIEEVTAIELLEF